LFYSPSTTSTYFLLTLGITPYQFEADPSDATDDGESIDFACAPLNGDPEEEE
jgi:hypothetical protein